MSKITFMQNDAELTHQKVIKIKKKIIQTKTIKWVKLQSAYGTDTYIHDTFEQNISNFLFSIIIIFHFIDISENFYFHVKIILQL